MGKIGWEIVDRLVESRPFVKFEVGKGGRETKIKAVIEISWGRKKNEGRREKFAGKVCIVVE